MLRGHHDEKTLNEKEESPHRVEGQGPLTPTGGWTGVLVLKIPSQGWVFSFGQVATWTPQMYGLWTPLDELMSMVLFLSSFSFNFEI